MIPVEASPGVWKCEGVGGQHGRIPCINGGNRDVIMELR